MLAPEKPARRATAQLSRSPRAHPGARRCRTADHRRPRDQQDTEMHPLVRWQFRGGIEEKDRKAFLFTNVTDSQGRRYDIPVVVGAIAANEEIYRIGMGVPLDRIDATWQKAMANPIKPTLVTDAPCQEIVITGDELLQPGKGLDGIPVPISTPAGTTVPIRRSRSTSTKDPDNGVQNMGNYRGQVKSPTRLGMNPSLELRPGIMVALGKVSQARRTHAGGGRPRLPAVDCVHVGAEMSRSGRRVRRCRRSRWRARSTWCERGPSICSFRRKPRS